MVKRVFSQDIEEGTVVAGFGAVRQLREGEEGTRTKLGYSFIVKEREGKSLTITPKPGVTEGCMAHAINHTCHPGFANCRFVHAGIVGGWSEDERGGIGGRRTSEVFVKTTKRVESDVELFANYGTKPRARIKVIRLGVTYLPFALSSDASYADLPLALLGAPVNMCVFLCFM
jgi:hypothetical protein